MTSQSAKLKPAQASILLVTLMTLIHLILAFKVELGGDEAHYALYGLMPDWSYFDHPPLIGWLQITPMWLAPYDWSARLVPIALYGLLNFLLYKVTNSLFSQNTGSLNKWQGFASLALLNSTLILPLMGMAMLPDNPLMVVVLALILVVKKLLDSPQPSLQQWLALGLLVGLAALAKYTAVTIVVSLLAIMLIEKRWHWLTQKGLWLAIVVALIMLTPVLYWNYSHDWASFIYQINHGTQSDGWHLDRLLQTQALQLVVYSPLLFIAGWWALLNFSNYRNQQRRLLLLFAVPVVLLFAWGSGFEQSLPHWTSLAWLLLIPIVVNRLFLALNQSVDTGKPLKSKLIKVLVGVHLVIFGGLMLLIHSFLYHPWLNFEKHQHPLQGDYGWPAASAKAKQWQQQLNQKYQQDTPLFVSNWSYASHLAWYTRPQPIYITSGKQTQFEFWYGRAKDGMNGLLVAPHYEPNPPVTKQRYHFEKCQLLETLPIYSGESLVVSYSFYDCRNFLDGQ